MLFGLKILSKFKVTITETHSDKKVIQKRTLKPYDIEMRNSLRKTGKTRWFPEAKGQLGSEDPTLEQRSTTMT
jgi:pyruvate/2-oxoglutarate/acetoin dehydrogenase E1 component